MAGQSEILTREVARVDAPTDEDALDDLGRNADLYIFHQDDAHSQQATSERCQERASSAAVSTGRGHRRTYIYILYICTYRTVPRTTSLVVLVF